MSNQALPRPRFNAPEPERGSKAALKIEARTAPLFQGKVREIPHPVFGLPVRLCPLPTLTPRSHACVVDGLWAIFILGPVLGAYVQPFLPQTLGWTGLVSGPPSGSGMLAAGVILAIMISPIISSITREVLTVVPQHQREAVLA